MTQPYPDFLTPAEELLIFAGLFLNLNQSEVEHILASRGQALSDSTAFACLLCLLRETRYHWRPSPLDRPYIIYEDQESLIRRN